MIQKPNNSNMNNCVVFLDFGWRLFFHSLRTEVSAKVKKNCPKNAIQCILLCREKQCALYRANYEYLKDNWMLFWTMKASALIFSSVFFIRLTWLPPFSGGLTKMYTKLNCTFYAFLCCGWNAFHLYSIEMHIHCAFFLLLFRCYNLTQLLIFVWKKRK